MNQIAIDFIKAREGCRLKAYQDSAGVWTIGYGHTGPDVHPDLLWTQAQADQALATRVAEIEAQVLMKTAPAPLTEQQAAALISFAYNLGLGAFGGSTLLKYVIARDWIAAAKEFVKWSHAGGIEVKGLLIRRFQEAVLFLQGSP